LRDGDVVFVRGSKAPCTKEEDAVVCWVTGWYVLRAMDETLAVDLVPLTFVNSKIYSKEMKEDLTSVRDKCLGPKELRTRAAPTKIGSAYQGGTHLERNDRANPGKPNTRCYTIGNTFEGPTKIMAPCKDGKLTGDGDTEALQLRSQLLKASRNLSISLFFLLIKLTTGLFCSGYGFHGSRTPTCH
jgi:hypothetical protein